MSDWIEQIDIAGDRYNLKDLQTSAQAQQNTQNIDTIESGLGYSTSEHLTGAKASDGRPIYKKQIVTTTPNQSATFPGNENSKSISVDASIKDFISCSGFIIHEESGVIVPLGAILTQTQFSTFWCRNNNHPQNPNSVAVAVGAVETNQKLVLDIEYTKITDTPQP